jgi:hypothetical protein
LNGGRAVHVEAGNITRANTLSPTSEET